MTHDEFRLRTDLLSEVEIGERLLKLATRSLAHAYAPYSGFSVAAAMLTADGRIHVGVNVENASLGLTVCAERTAIFAGIGQGAKKFVAAAVATSSPKTVSPCGACRQVMVEFMAAEAKIFYSQSGKVAFWSVGELLPIPFRFAPTGTDRG